jgi:hypothetical protein
MRHQPWICLLSLGLFAGCAPPPGEPTLPPELPPMAAPPRPSMDPLPDQRIILPRASPRPRRPPDVLPPILGGTLLISRDDRLAVAADPDRDRIWIVDLVQGRPRQEVVLSPGDEPWRVAEDGAGRFHVVLRGSGEILTIDRTATRRAVCPAPRGIGHEPLRDLLHVACQGGELVSLPAAAGPPVRLTRPDSDLRDVAVVSGRLFVSRFRAAEILEIAADGTLAARHKLGARQTSVAWRMVAAPDRALVVLHQIAGAPVVPISPGGYRVRPAECSGTSIVHTVITRLPLGGPPQSSLLAGKVAPLDIAIAPEGSNTFLATAGRQDGCAQPEDRFGRVTAAAYTQAGFLVLQVSDPPAIVFGDNPIPLPGERRSDPGRDLFYAAPRDNPLACVSCHPDGGDDGQVWNFAVLGLRRTQHPRGGLLGTEPFHWSGDMADFTTLMNEVFTRRMGSRAPAALQIQQLARWLDAQPPWPVSLPVDTAAVSRGERLFTDPRVGCSDCHAGPRLTSNRTVDVGTGGAFQVPSLLAVAARAPYLHDGRAATLKERFADRSDRHGRTSHLNYGELQDLIAYLESL